ncbi:MAG: DsbA family oxidoreductase [Rhizobacter sp.]|nr:DsbA family oxidoreductase [Chlorobiales bacterium]
MQVEIWSDVMCPFCYIGKRKFEKALAQFSHKENIEVVWKSFQLNPDLETNPSLSLVQSLAESKGISLARAREMTGHATALAAQVGLTYDFDAAVVANSFDAHRFSHLAKQHGVQDAAEERLFAAYFTEGKNTADHRTLIQLGTDIGLNAAEVRQTLESDVFAAEVAQDIAEARQVGVRGVPFFVLGGKYAVSGAQESETFLLALNKAWETQMQPGSSSPVQTNADAVCAPDGCEPQA